MLKDLLVKFRNKIFGVNAVLEAINNLKNQEQLPLTMKPEEQEMKNEEEQLTIPDWKKSIKEDKIARWISELVPNQTFADIGGIGVNSINERITLAVESGASTATMIDIRPSDYLEWEIFRKICADKKITNYQEIASIDINDQNLLNKIGSYDLVNCTGIFYHLPSPLLAFDNLAKVVNQYLIINTVTVPEKIENQFGQLNFSGSLAMFLPGINEQERKILREHYQRKFGWSIDDVAPPIYNQKNAMMPWRENGEFSCWPYWWLFTDEAFYALVKLMNFEIIDLYKWEDHTLQILAKKK
jgi:hypothetical protein